MPDPEEKKIINLDTLEEEVVPVEEEETEEEREIREAKEAEEEETDEEREIREAKEAEEEETDEEREIREAKEALETDEEKDLREEKEKEDKKKKEAKEGDEKSFDDIISDKYADRYDINSEEELGEILDDVDNILQQSEDLKVELEEAKKAPPKFKSKKEEKAFEFLQNYDVDKFGNGLGNLSRLIGMDVKEIDGKLALQEAYVLRNTELDREDALDLFNEEYEEYSVKRDGDEEDSVYDKKQKLKDIKRKQDVFKAKKFLSEQQEKMKVSDDDEGDPKKKADAKVPEVSKESLTKYSKKVESSMKGFNSIIVSSDEDGEGEEKFTYKLSKDELKKIELSLNAYIAKPENYKDGEMSDFNPDETKVNVAMALFGDNMLSEAIKHGISVGEGRKIERIGKKKPVRGQISNKKDEELSTDAQFEKLAEEKRKEREGKTQFA